MIENRYNVQLSTDVPEHKAEDFERWFDNVIGTDLQKDTDYDGLSSYVMCDITNYELRMVEDYENEYLIEEK
tara:strand:+ start:142 stop:357 length:216 start_codon:yes stop_codon:yes gene_type:complete